MPATAPPREIVSRIPEAYAYLFEPFRYKVAYSGRAAAKSWSYSEACLIQGAQAKKRIVCGREIQTSIKDSVHALLSDQIKRLNLGVDYKVNKSSIAGYNGTEFIFVGLKHNIDSIKSLEGADIFWAEEAQTVSNDSWKKAIPTIRKPGSEIWVTYNPMFAADPTHKRFTVDPPPNSKIVHTSWRDNPFFSLESNADRIHMKRTDPRGYLNVWEGEPLKAIEGAIFEKELILAEAQGRILPIPVDRTQPIDLFWDLGFGDKMGIWFAQICGPWYHLLHYLEDSGQVLDFYLQELQELSREHGYRYRSHWVGHDALDVQLHHNLGGDRTRSIEMLMRDAGLNVRLVPKMLQADQINAARSIFAKCRFDSDRCDEGLRALRTYQWGKEMKNGVQKTKPQHDAAAHGASAFQYFAMCMREVGGSSRRKGPKEPPSKFTSWRI